MFQQPLNRFQKNNYHRIEDENTLRMSGRKTPVPKFLNGVQRLLDSFDFHIHIYFTYTSDDRKVSIYTYRGNRSP